MANLPDVYCWIKLINQPSGKVIPSGATMLGSSEGTAGSITIRYVVANDSNKATGEFAVVGTLLKDGIKLPPPVPTTKLQLQPKELWKYEHVVNKKDAGIYEASMVSDMGGMVNEEDEKNNKDKAQFTITSNTLPS